MCWLDRAKSQLVDLLLLVEADLSGTAVDEQEKTTDNGEDLEEVVLCEVLVRMVLVKLLEDVSDLFFLLIGLQSNA